MLSLVNIEYETNRSVLYNIKPMSVETEFRESLSGYISRLAISHNVTQGILFSKLIAPVLNKKYINSITHKGGDGFYDSSSGINGTGPLARDFIEVISKLTSRNDLNELTLVSWMNIAPSKGLIRSEKAWCPKCYLEAFNNGSVVYDQLIWTIQLVKYCPIHEMELVSECPFCGKNMQVISRKSKPGYCSKCEKRLGITYNNTVEPTKKDLRIVDQVISLLNVSTTYERERVSDVLRYYVSNYLENNVSKAAMYFGVSKSTFRSWLKGKNIPTLKSLVSICLKLDITIPDFLEKKPLRKLVRSREVQANDKKIIKKHDHFFIEKFLNRYILEDYINSPKSLKNIAEIIGCDRRLLYIKYPKESKRIVEIYCEYLKVNKAVRQEKAENELLNVIQDLKCKGIYPSRRNVEAMFNGPYLIKEKNIALKWKKLIK